ncbi:alpha/beta fold hydrolase [Pasteurellaceae bacterium HPA106]|uniref:alpha/beta fold hydrolase n=1 Tax=Spirabiliibacterium pneumoniae TaxID=221400 RepID=UPI001AACB302|nr:alpha/beta fold hydrolase [Spirabiliibacterium pneumoniae]MBE2895360.1 alpha/beta fold hydrolase [Spirabiliibacterium pneumoniae]
MSQNTQFLHYQWQNAEKTISSAPTMVLLHGLFGDLNNLGVIARAFAQDYPVLKIDLRNHGHSFHSHEMNYADMAQDVITLLDQLSVRDVILVGHSMGGKTAMAAAERLGSRVKQLIVLDIAPVAYGHNGHDDVFNALFAVQKAMPATRQEAKPILQQHIQAEGVQQFMLKSFDASSPDRFLFNLTALYQNYDNIMSWQPLHISVPTLFIRGGRSQYVADHYLAAIHAQFSAAKIVTIDDTAHWLHAEKPSAVIEAIRAFLA